MLLALFIIIGAGCFMWWKRFSTETILFFYFCVVFASVLELSYYAFYKSFEDYQDYYELKYDDCYLESNEDLFCH